MPGEPYIVDGSEFRDLIHRIDLWHSYLGNRYHDVLMIETRFREEKESQEFAEKLALKFLQEDEDAKMAAMLQNH